MTKDEEETKHRTGIDTGDDNVNDGDDYLNAEYIDDSLNDWNVPKGSEDESGGAEDDEGEDDDDEFGDSRVHDDETTESMSHHDNNQDRMDFITRQQCDNENGLANVDENNTTSSFAGSATFSVASCLLEQCSTIWFVCIIVCSPVLIYIILHQNEVETFENEYFVVAGHTITQMERQMNGLISSSDRFSAAITTHAIHRNSTWPFVTLPNYDLIGTSILTSAHVPGISFQVHIESNERNEWEDYVEDNFDWFCKATERANETFKQCQEPDSYPFLPPNVPNFTYGYSREIYDIDVEQTPSVVVDSSDGPYLAVWQTVPLDAGQINFNVYSDPVMSDTALSAIFNTGEAYISEVEKLGKYDPTLAAYSRDVYSQWMKDLTGYPDAAYNDEPISTFRYPIFDSFDVESRNVVALLAMKIFWPRFFTEVIVTFEQAEEGGGGKQKETVQNEDENEGLQTSPSSEATALVCVIENTCGDVFSYKLDTKKSTVEYLGKGEHYDETYIDYGISFDLTSTIRRQQEKAAAAESSSSSSKDYDSSTANAQLSTDYCSGYLIRVYPTDELRQSYMTRRPLFVSSSIVLILIIIMTMTKCLCNNTTATTSSGTAQEEKQHQRHEQLQRQEQQENIATTAASPPPTSINVNVETMNTTSTSSDTTDNIPSAVDGHVIC